MRPSPKVVQINDRVEVDRITEDIVIGKDVLDLLTGAMYVDPLSIYREYIQNSADAVQEAREKRLYREPNDGAIELNIESASRTVTIRDDGIGVPQAEVVRRLTAIGASKKRGLQLRGFRGVGRLSGLGYCQQLVFRTRAAGDHTVSEIIWDGRALKDLLASDDAADLVDAIKKIAKSRVIAADGYPAHFFEVQLRGIARTHNDILLDESKVRAYLAQVAPVPFAADFTFGSAISEYLTQYGACDTFRIAVGNKQIYRPHSNQFPVTDKVFDTVSDVSFFEMPGIEDGPAAVGWILNHSYLGALPLRANVDGLRARVRNIQIGTSDIFANLFRQRRFNSWCIGEIHVLSKRIIPNGRRDDFETNAHLQSLRGHLANMAEDLTKLCRDKSVIRNRLKSAALVSNALQQSVTLLEEDTFPAARDYLRAHATKLLTQLGVIASSRLLSEVERTIVSDHYRALNERLRVLTPRASSKTPFFNMHAQARQAFENAIETVLASSLPMAARAELIDKIICRAAQSTASPRPKNAAR